MHMPMRQRLQAKQLAATDTESAGMLSIGRTLFRQMDASGALGPMSFRFGRARRWDPLELEAWHRAGRPRREAWVTIRESVMKRRAAG